MAYQVFARKYRPRTFDEVLGQDHVVQTLRNAIAKDRIAQAYLFVGPRGTGKTTTARILAKALNCSNGPRLDFDPDEDICREIAEGTSLDVLEIDGASNNGVEQVRELREGTKFAPARGRYKIYYIDEVHMLTTAAFNALLKTLEEPPPHVKFIFATTEPNKILPTILSRCQRFDLRRIPEKVIAEHILHIADLEGVDLDSVAALTIARAAEGGMRDAQSMLDQLVAFCGNEIRQSQVLEIFGVTAHETVADLTGHLLGRRAVEALNLLHEQSEKGKDLTRLLADLIAYFRTLLVFKVDPQNSIKELLPEVMATLEEQAELVPMDRLIGLIDQFAEIDARMKWAPNKKLHLEIGLIKGVQSLNESSLSDVIAVLSGAITGTPGEINPIVPSPPAPSIPKSPVSKAPPASKPKAKAKEVAAPEPEPKAVVPVKEEEPPLATAPESAPSGGSGNGQDWWPKLKAMAMFAFSAAIFKEFSKGVYRVSVPNDVCQGQALMKQREMEALLTELAGSQVKLLVDVDPSLEEIDDSPSLPGRVSAPAERFVEEDTFSAPTSAPPTEPTDAEAFYNDPFIQKALDLFGATLEKKPS